MEQPLVFISREQPPQATFRQQLEAAGRRVHGESLVELTPVAFDSPPPADWIFFYSPRAVDFFGATAQPTAGQRLAAIGPGTAAACRQQGWAVDFTGTGQPADVAAAFGELAAGQAVLFPQARQSRRSVERALGARIRAFPLIVYDNLPRGAVRLPAHDTAVFTSPINARTYFRYYPPRADVSYVAIGPSTAQALRALGLTDFRTATQPDEAALARAVLAG